MAIRRTKGDRHIIFDCDGPGCDTSIETGLEDFSLAYELAKEEGFGARKQHDEWKHFCEDCLDG